jgi:hypothetical protein
METGHGREISYLRMLFKAVVFGGSKANTGNQLFVNGFQSQNQGIPIRFSARIHWVFGGSEA